MSHIIELRGLAKTYRKGPQALAGVDLDVPESSRFTLLGANGAGTSTLVRILCTLLHADVGSATICGQSLSGGNKRRLHVALALVHQPRVLFLDEPTVGMDPESRAAFWAELRRLNTEEGTTVFFTTQYLEEAGKHGDQLALIATGRIAYRGTVKEFSDAHGGPDGDLEAGYLNFLAQTKDKEPVNA